LRLFEQDLKSEQAILLNHGIPSPGWGWYRHYSQQHYHPDWPADIILLGKAITFPQWRFGAAFAPKILTTLFNGI
jgi:hypothetical protein